jgi:hypothetical protein
MLSVFAGWGGVGEFTSGVGWGELFLDAWLIKLYVCIAIVQFLLQTSEPMDGTLTGINNFKVRHPVVCI